MLKKVFFCLSRFWHSCIYFCHFSFLCGFINHLPLVFYLLLVALKQQFSIFGFQTYLMFITVFSVTPGWSKTLSCLTFGGLACLKLGGERLFSPFPTLPCQSLLPQPSFSFCFFQYDEPLVWNQTCDLCPINVIKWPLSYYIFWLTRAFVLSKSIWVRHVQVFA